MPSFIQRSFAGGELAPALYARADQAKYQSGAKSLRNFLVQKHGGASNRAGFRFRAETKVSSGVSWLLPFIFDDTQAYVIEAGDHYFRFFQNGAAIITTAVASWSGATAYILGDLVTSGGVTFYCIAAHTNQAPPNAAYWYAQTGNIYEIPTPYAAADLHALQLDQSADVVTIVHNGYPIMDLSRFGTTRWTLTTKILIPTIAAPANCGATASAGSGTFRYRVTSVGTDTGEESLPGTETAKNISGATQANPCVLTVVAHGYSNGDEVTIGGVLGMTALNGVTATIGGVAANTFQLIGVDSSAFPAYISGGKVARTYARVDSAAAPTSGTPITVTWSAVAGVTQFNVFKYINGAFGFVGVAQGTAFVDLGYTPDFSASGGSPPAARNLFGAPGDYPAAVAYTQFRLVFANTLNNPKGVWASRTDAFGNFTSRTPLQDDDPLIFSMNGGKRSNAVRNLTEVAGRMVVLTSGAVWTLAGNAEGVLTPTAINPNLQGSDGSNGLEPIGIGASALFVQARGTIVRELRYSLQDSGYTGNDLTVFSTHLFSGKTLVDWSYAAIPNPVVWVVRNDGILLALTYVREQNLTAWAPMDTDGAFESCVVVPEGSEDVLYCIVRRTIGGVTKRYVESMASRQVSDIAVDAFFVDSGLTYDGRSTSGATITLSALTGWTVTDTQTATTSTGQFSASNVGDAVVLKILSTVDVIDPADRDRILVPAGTVLDSISLKITGYTDANHVTVTPARNVPAGFQGVPTGSWSKAVRGVARLGHLEGKTVSILGDGNVDTPQVVTGGAVTFSRPWSVAHVGLPYVSNLETLDIENLQGETLSDKTKRPNRVALLVEASRGGEVGIYGQALYELKQRATEAYGLPTMAKTGLVVINIPGTWQDNARVRVRQTEPLPTTVLAVIPSGLIGG